MLNAKIIHFLTKRNWQASGQTDSFFEFRPPAEFDFSPDYRVYIPRDLNRVDSNAFITNVVGIISDIYNLTLDDLNVILEKENTVLKVRVYDKQTEEGKISLTRFEELIERIRAILSDTASFVIDKSVTSTRVPDEVYRYLSMCNFMQTEKGSFVAKIQLPSKELIKDNELFERDEIYSEEINLKLSQVLSFVNQNIFEQNAQASEDYLLQNEANINIKLLKDIELFYSKAELKNIDFQFHNLDSTSVITSNGITKEKIYRLTQFVEQIEAYSFEIGEFDFKGKIVSLKSKDPDGLKNSVAFTGVYDNIPMVGSANLESEQYKAAIEAHKLKQYIVLRGLAKKTKTRIRFTEITQFNIED